MKFGLAVPVFANPGVPDFRMPNCEEVHWEDIVSLVREAENLGYQSLWVADHMFLGHDGFFLENWTTLSALSVVTSRMRLGTIHLGNGFRHAPLVAKMVGTLDFISNGRVELFLDPGWREREHTSYGFEWNADRAARVERLAEAIHVMRAMWKGTPTTYRGQYYTVDGAICAPIPLKAGGPRIWMGESINDEELDLIAREADVWNSVPASPEFLASKIKRLTAACERNGRDPKTIVKTLETQVLICDDKEQVTELFNKFSTLRERYPSGDAMSDIFDFFRQIDPTLAPKMRPEDFYDEFVIGTPEEVAEKLRAYQALGIDEVICWFMDYPDRTSIRLLVSKVWPMLDA